MVSQPVKDRFYTELTRLAATDPKGALNPETIREDDVISKIEEDLDFIWPAANKPFPISRERIREVAQSYFCAWNRGYHSGYTRGHYEGFVG